MKESLSNPALPYYSILLDLPIEVGECFTYSSDEPVGIGERVEVELGKRSAIGYVVGTAEAMPNAKKIVRRLDGFPLMNDELIELTRWMAGQYYVSWYRSVAAILPAALKRSRMSRGRVRTTLHCSLSLDEVRERYGSDERIFSALAFVLEHPGSTTIVELERRFELSRTRIETLVRKSVLTKTSSIEERSPFARGSISERDSPLVLSAEQRIALGAILARANDESRSEREVLITGVTGSGKTEVYLQAIAKMLEQGKGAIVLVPEISLTPQTVDRFRRRFGETVAILHSNLSAGERHDEWTRLRTERARVVVGARSAIFAPVARLGLIVVDEAHESSYKQGDSPRYNAIEVARERARISKERAVLVLGTATPSCEMSSRAAQSVRLTERVGARPMPLVTVVDMRQELAHGNRSIFSVELRSAMKRALVKKEQVLLFLNRRGHASFILCRTCGHTISCPRCAVSLTLHHSSSKKTGARMLICHFCNHREAQPSACPECRSSAIRAFGAGTQRVEEGVKRIFPAARTVRMDADTTVAKGEHRRILGKFADGEYDILIGTQMIGKGLDLPRITVVGVIAADSSLHLPDFRASERTFQILVQVAGRAGRADKPGRAIIQTYVPDHYAVRAAATHDIDQFVSIEKELRRAASLPPFTRILQWTFESESEQIVRSAATRAVTSMEGLPGTVLGPAPAPIEFLRGRKRWQMRWLFDPATAREVLGDAVSRIRGLKQKDLRIVVDVDPIDLM